MELMSTNLSTTVSIIMIISITIGCVVYLYMKQKVNTLENELKKVKTQRDSEHNGRIALQKEIRLIASSKLQSDGALFYSPIGESDLLVGTPRQGHLAPNSRAIITFKKSMINSGSLDGLECFSHVWVFFVFHLNNNPKWIKGFSSSGDNIVNGKMFPSKITPPFLKKKVGLFATRSPHRPNNIGISLCTIKKIDHKNVTVHLTGVDLVDGTPVLDIKPFVSFYDSISPASVAPWVENSLCHAREVSWLSTAEQKLFDLSEELQLYKNEAKKAFLAITECLAVDVRSKFMTLKAEGKVRGGTIKGTSNKGILLFDSIQVHWKINGDFDSVTVENVQLA